jgi:LytS/YehU family sensor histidine kinase
MLRHILYDNMEQEVQLEDEVKFLQNYISLMKIRQPVTVEVNLDTQQVVPQVKIAPLILIPLVENAFKHGVSPTERSFIRITISADKHFIYCDIQNSNHPKTASDHSGHGIGLQQVERRLELAYPNHYTWEKGTKENNTIYYSTITIQL